MNDDGRATFARPPPIVPTQSGPFHPFEGEEPVSMVTPSGKFQPFDPLAKLIPPNFIAARCSACGHRWLLDYEGSFRCPACWHDDGSWPADPQAERGSPGFARVVAEAAMDAARRWAWYYLHERPA